MIENKDLIRILKGVPETRLRLLELCHKLLTKNGDVDPQKVAFYSKELEEAVKEAEQYSRETKEAVICLRELAPS